MSKHYRKLASQYKARANRTCARTHFRLVPEFPGTRRSLLEVGSGADDVLNRLESRLSAACDLSLDMLLARSRPQGLRRVVAAEEMLQLGIPAQSGRTLVTHTGRRASHILDPANPASMCAGVFRGARASDTPGRAWRPS
jgi:hypothetical protein